MQGRDSRSHPYDRRRMRTRPRESIARQGSAIYTCEERIIILGRPLCSIATLARPFNPALAATLRSFPLVRLPEQADISNSAVLIFPDSVQSGIETVSIRMSNVGEPVMSDTPPQRRTANWQRKDDKKRRRALAAWRNELENREADLRRRETELSDRDTDLKQRQQDLSTEVS